MSAELLGDMKDSALSSVGIDDRKDDELNSVELSWLAEFKVLKESWLDTLFVRVFLLLFFLLFGFVTFSPDGTFFFFFLLIEPSLDFLDFSLLMLSFDDLRFTDFVLLLLRFLTTAFLLLGEAGGDSGILGKLNGDMLSLLEE